ncbi:hypothetical protein O181_096740 [Austropuccinia psidii MF-1]|uniref:Integrase catalytic domain-containing protein n=1 Tax=Austropuccinia psidii MF-1 TaxID=1389203 RepID=A0A9Q3J648_9BASI|nr:hypothetical protein [Austropuccinia psidii MF-1]
MVKIQEPSRPWEIFHMNWVTGLPPGGDRSYNACLVIVDRFSKTPIFLPSHKDDTAMDTALLISNHPQTDGLAERMIQTLEHMTTIHASTNQTPAILGKGWNPKLPHHSLRKELIEIHPTAPSFKGMLDKARKHAVRCMEDSFAYAKDKWDKSYSTTDFKALHGENAVEVELSEKLSNKHPTNPASLIKPYKSSDAEKFPLSNKVPQVIPTSESSCIKNITNFLKERNLRTNKVREYLVRYSDPTCEDECVAAKDIPEATQLLRRFRHTRNNDITK